MANFKSIADVPVAESAEGLNLIVNDGGSAKQIPAGQVGAQADWSVADTSNPAFIKNKPEIPEQVQADWNVTDETNPAFIMNKPEIGVGGYVMEVGADECLFDTDTLAIKKDPADLANAISSGVSGVIAVPGSVVHMTEVPLVYFIPSFFAAANVDGVFTGMGFAMLMGGGIMLNISTAVEIETAPVE